MTSAVIIDFVCPAIAIVSLMNCILSLSVIGNKAGPVNIINHNNKGKTFLIESAEVSSPYFVLLLVIAGMSILSVFFFVKRINKLKKETDIVVREQKLLIDNLEKTIVALENSKEEAFLQQSSMKRIAMVLSHDLQSPFRFLVASTETLYHSIVNNNYGDARRISIEIKRSGEQMLRFLMDFTIWIKSISKSYNLRTAVVDVHDLFEEMESFFSEQLRCCDNILTYKSDEPVMIAIDKDLLKIVIRNIIDNANKNCTNGTIRMEIKREGKHCTITIEDNGKGMTTVVLNKIKDIIRQEGLYAADSNTGDKQGYRFIAHFARLLHIEIDIESQPQRGTKIQLNKLTIV
jgi:signal transduction histidine kinase